MIPQELLQVEKTKISAASTSFTFCGHRTENAEPLDCPSCKDLRIILFIMAATVLSFAVITVHMAL